MMIGLALFSVMGCTQYHRPQLMRYRQNNDMMMMSLSGVETICVVEGSSTLMIEKKRTTCEVHQMQAPKYYVQNCASIKFEMHVELVQPKCTRERCAFI
jgi:hypothetical protein